MNTVLAIIVGIGGIIFAVSNKRFARASEASNRRLFGKEPTSDEPKIAYRLGFAVGGTLIFVMAVLHVVGVLPTRS